MAQASTTPASEHQKAQVLDLLQQGRSLSEIAQVTGLSVGQVRSHKAHVTMGTYTSDTADAEEAVEAIQATMGLERDLQRALRAHIDQIEPDLRIIDGGGEMTVASGRIDIVAEDSAGTAVVIELKAGTAGVAAIGQILSYMSDLDLTKPSVRGIIVAGDFAPPAISAARRAGIRLLRYSFKFTFEVVGP